jgi:hypothetical protein
VVRTTTSGTSGQLPFHLKMTLNNEPVECLYVSIFMSKETNKTSTRNNNNHQELHTLKTEMCHDNC